MPALTEEEARNKWRLYATGPMPLSAAEHLVSTYMGERERDSSLLRTKEEKRIAEARDRIVTMVTIEIARNPRFHDYDTARKELDPFIIKMMCEIRTEEQREEKDHEK